MNKVVLVGRLTKEPEIRYTITGNIPVCSFTLAVDRRYKQNNGAQADFIPIIAWRSTAEFCSKYFSKGRKIIVSGRIETRNWEDSEGKKHYVTEVIAEEVDFADSKKNDASTPPEPPAPPPAENQQPKSQGYTPPATPPPAQKMPWE